MPFGINNPLPSSMSSECRKCGKILASFVDPRQAFGPDKIIPPEILANAKGLAILTVVKFGFIGSGRFGSGVVVARLSDGSWSAPSAIGTAGGGIGGQIGLELTDFVFILNDAAAVKTFAQAGSITLGGNVSVAAGPVGRNAEAAGAASLKSVSGVFAYSKTKGLFAGVSLEGGVVIERREANEKLYGRSVKAADLLRGAVPFPPSAEALLRVLNSRVFAGVAGAGMNDETIYNDIPVYNDTHDDVIWQGQQSPAYGQGQRNSRSGSLGQTDDYQYRDKPQRTSTWQDDVYDRPQNFHNSRANPGETFDLMEARTRGSSLGAADDYSYKDRPKPARPTGPKPAFGTAKKSELASNQVIAKFTFDPDQPGDLGFKKGDVITVIKRTENETDWWTGRIGNREGIFPSNYVQTV